MRAVRWPPAEWPVMAIGPGTSVAAAVIAAPIWRTIPAMRTCGQRSYEGIATA